MYDVIILKALGLDADSTAQEIQLAPLGVYTDGHGRRFRVTETEVEEIIANSTLKTNDTVIDYEHQTLSNVEAPAAGWVKELINKGKDGLWGVVEWTEKAKGYLANKEYRYLSPVLLANRKDTEGNFRPTRLHSGALTNTPQIDGMVPIVNKLDPQNMKEERPMKRLLEAMGLKPEATEDEAIAAWTALRNKAANPETKEVLPQDVLDALDLKEGASPSEATATILALKQPGNVVSMEEFNKLKKDLAEKNRDELVQLAMKEGKITAAQKDWAEEYALRDPDGFKVFVNKAPQVVPMGDAPKGGGDEKKTSVTEDTMLVAKMFGHSKDDLEKFGGAGKDA